MRWGTGRSRVAPDIELDPSTQKELSRWVRTTSTTQVVALRVRIIPAVARGRSNQEIAATLGITAKHSHQMAASDS